MSYYLQGLLATVRVIATIWGFFLNSSWATEAEGYEKLPDWCVELLDFYHARTEWSYSLVMTGMITSQDGCNATFQGLGA